MDACFHCPLLVTFFHKLMKYCSLVCCMLGLSTNQVLHLLNIIIITLSTIQPHMLVQLLGPWIQLTTAKICTIVMKAWPIWCECKYLANSSHSTQSRAPQESLAFREFRGDKGDCYLLLIEIRSCYSNMQSELARSCNWQRIFLWYRPIFWSFC